jgi:hypothetical protein
MQERSAFDIAMLVFAAIAAVSGVIAVLPLFGIDLRIIGRPKVPLDQGALRGTKRAWLALVLVLVSLGLSAGAFYYFFHPRVVEKTVEKTVEKPETIPCAEQKTPVVTPIPGSKPPKKSAPSEAKSITPQAGIQQSNSGGVNVLQGTTGENSPIINSPITVGDVPKRISPAELTNITQYLATAQTKPHIKILAFQNGNAVPLAKDIYKAFHDAGWPMSENGVVQALGIASAGQDLFQGAIITVKGVPLGPNEKVTVSVGDPLYYVSAVLDTLKIPRVLSREPNFDDGLIFIQFPSLPQ